MLELRRHGQLADAGADPHTINTSGLATHDSPSIAAEPSASAAHAPPAHPRRPSARGRSSGGPLAGLLAMRAGQQSAGGTLTPGSPQLQTRGHVTSAGHEPALARSRSLSPPGHFAMTRRRWSAGRSSMPQQSPEVPQPPSQAAPQGRFTNSPLHTSSRCPLTPFQPTAGREVSLDADSSQVGPYPEQQALTQTTLARASCSPSSLAFLGGISSTSTDLDILDSSCTRQLLQDVMELEADMPLSNWGTGSAESSLAEPAIPGLSMHGIMEPDLGIATGSYSHAGTTRTILSHPMLQMQPSALSGPAWADSSNTWPAMEIHGPAGGALPPSVHTGGSPAVDWRNVRSAIHSTAGGMLPPSASLGPPAVEQRNFGEAIPSDDSRVLPDPNMESVPHWKQVQSDMPDPASRTPPPSAFSLTDMTNSSGAGLGASRPALGGLPSTGLATAPPDWDGTWREGPSPHVPSRLLFGSIGATSADQGSALPRLPDRRPAWSYPTSPATLPPLGIGTSPWLAIHGPDTDMLASTSPRAVLADRSASWPVATHPPNLWQMLQDDLVDIGDEPTGRTVTTPQRCIRRLPARSASGYSRTTPWPFSPGQPAFQLPGQACRMSSGTAQAGSLLPYFAAHAPTGMEAHQQNEQAPGLPPGSWQRSPSGQPQSADSGMAAHPQLEPAHGMLSDPASWGLSADSGPMASYQQPVRANYMLRDSQPDDPGSRPPAAYSGMAVQQEEARAQVMTDVSRPITHWPHATGPVLAAPHQLMPAQGVYPGPRSPHPASQSSGHLDTAGRQQPTQALSIPMAPDQHVHWTAAAPPAAAAAGLEGPRSQATRLPLLRGLQGGPLDSSSGAPLPQGGHPGADDLQVSPLCIRLWCAGLGDSS